MKVLKLDDNSYIIYMFYLLDKRKLEDRQGIVHMVKDAVLKVNKIYHLNLKGFYKVCVYLNKRVGLIIEIVNIDDISIGNTIDLRVLVYFDQEFYFEVYDYDFLPRHKKIVYANDKFYVNVNSLSERELLLMFERGNIIYKIDEMEEFRFGKTIMS